MVSKYGHLGLEETTYSSLISIVKVPLAINKTKKPKKSQTNKKTPHKNNQTKTATTKNHTKTNKKPRNV